MEEAAAPTLAVSAAAAQTNANETQTQPSTTHHMQESNEPNNAKQTQLPTMKSQKPETSTPMKVVIPPPPPGVPEIQLKMWSKALSVRVSQLKQLPIEHLTGLADEIRKDTKTSRFGKNEYSSVLAHVLRKKGEDWDGDLAAGLYSSLYLQEEHEISAESIGRHFLALFYRSIDNRLAPAMNKHGLDALREAFASLDKWRKKKVGEKSRKRKRPVVEENDNTVLDNDAITARKDDEAPANIQEQQVVTESLEPVSKRASVATEPPPLAQTEMVAAPVDAQLDNQQEGALAAATSGNTDVAVDDPCPSLVRAAMLKGFSAVFLRGKTNTELLALVPGAEIKTHVTEKVSETLNPTDSDQPPQLNVPVAKDTSLPEVNIPAEMNNKELIDEEMREEPPKNDGKVAAINQNSTQPTQLPHGVELEMGTPSIRESVGGDNKTMTDVSCEDKGREETATTLVDRPELRVEETSVAMSNNTLNRCDSKDGKTDAMNESPPKIPVGYRRRSVRKCIIEGCPNHGDKCDLHGELAKTCVVEGCDNFQIQGFDVCIKHGAKNPNPKKGNEEASKTYKESLSNVPAGYRRRTLRNCIIEDCLNKGQKCGLHGQLFKTCKEKDCFSFRIPGHEVCIRHGAKHPNNSRKEDGASGRSNNRPSTPSNTNQGDQASNQLQAATNAPADPQRPVTPQMSSANESQAASAKVPPVQSLKRETTTDGTQVKSNRTIHGERGTLKNNDAEELIDLTEDTPVKEAPPRRLIPSPPSPPPSTILRNPPPPTKPRPVPFSDVHRVLFCPDIVTQTGTTSGCVKDFARQETLVEFDRGYYLDGTGGSLDDEQRRDVIERLNTWDPYWKSIEELGCRDVSCENGMTRVGTRTTACLQVPNPIMAAAASAVLPASCAMVSIDFRQEISRATSAKTDGKGRRIEGFRPWNIKWGQPPPDNPKLGDRRVIMRCLPLRRIAADEEKRADIHLWPRGSFVQIKIGNACDQVVRVIQRKQQSHDHSKWLGNSRHLDLTQYVADTNHPMEIKICSKEIIEGSSDGAEALMNSYAINVAVCEYTPPGDLYDQLMGKAEGGDVIMPKLSLRSAKRMLKECIANNTISLDSDEEEGNEKESESDFLTFSLLCHASKKCIETPVRGQSCSHLQCFDLRNYLNTNSVVCAKRWKCPYCEKFVSIRDLVHCGLFQAILDDVGDKIVPGVRDNVRVNADGTWVLLGENKLRYKRSSSAAEADASAALNVEEVIESDGPEEVEIVVIV